VWDCVGVEGSMREKKASPDATTPTSPTSSPPPLPLIFYNRGWYYSVWETGGKRLCILEIYHDGTIDCWDEET